VRLERTEHLEDLVVVRHVESAQLDAARRAGGEDLCLEVVQLLRTPRAQRQVVPLGCELPRHLGAQAAARTGDQDRLAHLFPSVRSSGLDYPFAALTARPPRSVVLSGR